MSLFSLHSTDQTMLFRCESVGPLVDHHITLLKSLYFRVFPSQRSILQTLVKAER